MAFDAYRHPKYRPLFRGGVDVNNPANAQPPPMADPNDPNQIRGGQQQGAPPMDHGMALFHTLLGQLMGGQQQQMPMQQAPNPFGNLYGGAAQGGFGNPFGG